MKKEIEFVRSATRKLRYKGDVTEEEATYIFFLGSVMYAYELGQHFERQYLNNFNFKFNYSELSQALAGWYKEVRSWIPDAFSFHNFVTTIPSIPSPDLYPPPMNSPKTTPYAMKAIREIWKEKGFILGENLKTKSRFYTSKEMAEWLKNNVPLSFDIICHESGDISFARFGVLGLLPIHEREVEEKGLAELLECDIPLFHSRDTIRGTYMFHDRVYSVACPVEYKDLLDAAADNLPVPEKPPETSKTVARTPKDISYINSLTSRLPFRDITEDEADDIYLLLKMYQALRIAALKENGSLRQQIKDAAEPGLNSLLSWYKAVEKKLAKNEHGNFVYTLPSDLDMNLYQLRKPIERSLKMLPEEPSEIVARFKDEFIVKDVLLDTKFTKETGVSDEYVRYHSSRYGFFRRNGINLSKWKPVMRCEKSVGEDILDRSLGIPILGKLRFAEFSLGIKQIVMGDAVAVKEEDYQKMLEVLKLSNSKIMEIAELLVQKELEEIQTERGKLAKTSENSEKLDALERRESILKRESGIPLEHVIKGVEIAYKAQRDREEFIEENEWMEMTR